jgi:hypothetical protein
LRISNEVHFGLKTAQCDLGIDAGEFTFVTSDEELKAVALKAGLAGVDPQEQA